jgi:hypothetical protein
MNTLAVMCIAFTRHKPSSSYAKYVIIWSDEYGTIGTRWGKADVYLPSKVLESDCHPIPVFFQRKDVRKLQQER